MYLGSFRPVFSVHCVPCLVASGPNCHVLISSAPFFLLSRLSLEVWALSCAMKRGPHPTSATARLLLSGGWWAALIGPTVEYLVI